MDLVVLVTALLAIVTLFAAGFMTWVEDGGYPDGLSHECIFMWCLGIVAGLLSLLFLVV